ncbi:9042_t:CDS:2 [Gigaspora rosea]|nr:9042_t:CDS:2 [Gigaspora rosea]
MRTRENRYYHDPTTNQQKFAITTDAWTSCTNIGFLAVTLHWIDESWTMKRILLDMIPLHERHTGNYISEKILETISFYNIGSRIVSATTDNASNMDLNTFAGYIRKSQPLFEELKRIFQANGKPFLVPDLDVPTRWNSTTTPILSSSTHPTMEDLHLIFPAILKILYDALSSEIQIKSQIAQQIIKLSAFDNETAPIIREVLYSVYAQYSNEEISSTVNTNDSRNYFRKHRNENSNKIVVVQYCSKMLGILLQNIRGELSGVDTLLRVLSHKQSLKLKRGRRSRVNANYEVRINDFLNCSFDLKKMTTNCLNIREKMMLRMRPIKILDYALSNPEEDDEIDDEMLDKMYMKRFNAGLFTLQLDDLTIAWIYYEEPHG